MNQDRIAQEMAALVGKARVKAGKVAAKAGKVAAKVGEKALSHASRVAMKRGLVDRAVSLDEAMETIRKLRDRGGLSREEFHEVRQALLKRFRGSK